MKEQAAPKPGGVSANTVILPIVITVALLHLVIVLLIFGINSQSSRLSTVMRESGEYTQDATSLLAGSSLLSETATNFVLMPVTEQGEVNAMPLTSYANELSMDRRGDQVSARFQTYHVSEAVRQQIATAAASANYMMAAQLHAIALMTADHPLPPVQALNALQLPELTAEELALSAEERAAAARVLVLGSVYALNKQSVAQCVSSGVNLLRAESDHEASIAGRQIGLLRAVLWIVTLLVIAILVISFTLLYRMLVSPLRRYSRFIDSGTSLEEHDGLREVRLLAAAYNALLRRRDAIDGILRSAAETDRLTGLPNRSGFEHYLLNCQDSGHSMAVLLFDVNYLKETNDSKGHAAGDALLRAAAKCISECFGQEGENNCFRFGGDEFAAVAMDTAPDRLGEMTRRFQECQEQEKISVSWGLAYTEDIGRTSYRQLLDEADKRMYEHKKRIHSQEGPSRPWETV